MRWRGRLDDRRLVHHHGKNERSEFRKDYDRPLNLVSMNDGRSKYVLFLIALIAGAGLTAAQKSGHGIPADHTLCLFKNITTVPCPSCGLTRAMVYLVDGNTADAVMTNPLVILVLGLAMAGTVAIVRDVIVGRRNFPQLWTD